MFSEITLPIQATTLHQRSRSVRLFPISPRSDYRTSDVGDRRAKGPTPPTRDNFRPQCPATTRLCLVDQGGRANLGKYKTADMTGPFPDTNRRFQNRAASCLARKDTVPEASIGFQPANFAPNWSQVTACITV